MCVYGVYGVRVYVCVCMCVGVFVCGIACVCTCVNVNVYMWMCACVVCIRVLHLDDCVQRCKAAGLEILPFLEEVETEAHIEETQMLDAV